MKSKNFIRYSRNDLEVVMWLRDEIHRRAWVNPCMNIADCLREGSDLLRTLAINEHLSWNAFHIMMGYYRTWNVLDAEKGAMDHV